jgi:hypothetical protein
MLAVQQLELPQPTSHDSGCFSKSDQLSIFQAEGSNLVGQPSTKHGGGGRILLIVKNLLISDITPFVSVRGYQNNDGSLIPNSGTIFIQDSNSDKMLALRNPQNSSTESNIRTAQTLIQTINLGVAMSLSIKNSYMKII